MPRPHHRIAPADPADPDGRDDGPGRRHRKHRSRHPLGPAFGRGAGRPRRVPRARRGDVRSAILRLLAEEPRTGYGLIRETEERSHGAWTPSAGAIYPALALLEDEGLVRGSERDGRRTYELTDAGRVASEERADERAPWDTVRGEIGDDALALSDAADQLGGAVVQVQQAGTPEQVRAATEILADARRRIFRTLAGD